MREHPLNWVLGAILTIILVVILIRLLNGVL